MEENLLLPPKLKCLLCAAHLPECTLPLNPTVEILKTHFTQQELFRFLCRSLQVKEAYWDNLISTLPVYKSVCRCHNLVQARSPFCAACWSMMMAMGRLYSIVDSLGEEIRKKMHKADETHEPLWRINDIRNQLDDEELRETQEGEEEQEQGNSNVGLEALASGQAENVMQPANQNVASGSRTSAAVNGFPSSGDNGFKVEPVIKMEVDEGEGSESEQDQLSEELTSSSTDSEMEDPPSPVISELDVVYRQEIDRLVNKILIDYANRNGSQMNDENNNVSDRVEEREATPVRRRRRRRCRQQYEQLQGMWTEGPVTRNRARVEEEIYRIALSRRSSRLHTDSSRFL